MTGELSEAHWENWSRSTWNERLLDFYFGAGDNDYDPVRRLVVTYEELAQALGDETASREAIRAGLRFAVEGAQSLIVTAKKASRLAGWTTDSTAVPPFVSHLVVTCLAASVVDGDQLDEGDFRKRLSELTKQPPTLSLTGLPKLWSDLAAWLRLRRLAGEPYRLLLLPDPGWESQIGHSKGLAFPPLRDYRKLLAYLDERGLLGAEPPVAETMQVMLNRRSSFGPLFREALDALHRLFVEGEDVGSTALWSAVRSAALHDPASDKGRRRQDDWRLIAEPDDFQILPVIVGRFAWNQGPFTSQEIAELGEHRFALTATPEAGDGDEFDSAVRRVFDGDPLAPNLPELRRAVRDGLLLFEWDVNRWSLIHRLPETDSVWALASPEVAEALLGAVAEGPNAPYPDAFVRASSLPGWQEVGGLEGRNLASLDFSNVPELEHIRALQKLSRPPALHLLGGIKLGSKRFLGVRQILPAVTVDAASSVVARVAAEEIQLTQAEERTWRFPGGWEPTDGADLEFFAETSSGPLGAGIRFESRVVTHSYKPPTDRGQWRCEGTAMPSVTIGTLLDEGLLEVSTREPVTADWSDFVEDQLFGSGDQPWNEVSDAVCSLERALAAYAVRRAGIAERDLLQLFDALLNPSRPRHLWDLVRAWCEAGCLVRGSDKRWRGASYFAVPPCLIQFQVGPRVGVALMGLTTSSLRARFRTLVRTHGGTVSAREPESAGLLPMAPRAVLPDPERVADLSRAMELAAPPRWLRPVDEIVGSVATATERDEVMPANYQLHSCWDWRRSRLDDEIGSVHRQNGVRVSCHRRTDAPDIWSIDVAGSEVADWWSYSRTWALLRGHWLAGGFPFEPGDDDLHRRPGALVHLPIGIGNLLAAVCASPGPSDGQNDSSYAYRFGTSRLREEVRQLLGDLAQVPTSKRNALDPGHLDPKAVSTTEVVDADISTPVQNYLERVVWPALGREVRSAVRVGGDGVDLHLQGGSMRLDIALNAKKSSETSGRVDVVEKYDAVDEQDRLRRLVLGDDVLHPLLRGGPVRPHLLQEEALASLQALRDRGETRAMVVMATGLGKTILSALDAKRCAKRVLFIVHSNSILEQAREAYARVFPTASMGLMNSAEKRPDADIVFANIATMRLSHHRNAFRPGEFDYVVYDEFHHAATAHGEQVLRYFRPKFFLGMTATPNRTDQRTLLHFVDGNLAYQATQHDGIRRGYLSPFKYFALKDNIDYSKIKHSGVRYNAADLNRHLVVRERDSAIIREFENRATEGPAIAFCVSIEHAKRAAKHFNDAGISAVAVHSGLSYQERQNFIAKFREGSYRIAMVRDLFNEGVDFPAVETLIFMRPTESKIIFTQQLGRGLRVAPGKKHVQVLDFIGNYFNAHRIVDFLSESSSRKVTWDELRKRNGKLELELGVDVNFDVKLVRELSLLDRGIDTEADVVEAYYRLVRQLHRPPHLVDVNRDAKLGVRRVLRAFGSWRRFLSRLESLEEDTSGLMWPAEYSGMTLDEIVEWSDGESGVMPTLTAEVGERFSLVRDAFEEVEQCRGKRGYETAFRTDLPRLCEEIDRILQPLRDLDFVLQFADIRATKPVKHPVLGADDGASFSQVMGNVSSHRDAYTLGRRMAKTLAVGKGVIRALKTAVRKDVSLGSGHKEQLAWLTARLTTHLQELRAALEDG